MSASEIGVQVGWVSAVGSGPQCLKLTSRWVTSTGLAGKATIRIRGRSVNQASEAAVFRMEEKAARVQR